MTILDHDYRQDLKLAAEPSVNPHSRVGAVWCSTCGCFTLPLNDGKCGFCNNFIVFKETCRIGSDDISETIPATA